MFQFKSTIKRSGWLSALTIALIGCASQQQTNLPQLPPEAHQVDFSTVSVDDRQNQWLEQTPADYWVWQAQGDRPQMIKAYQQYLQQNRVDRAAPMYQLLRSARDWQKCGRAPYAIPPREIWDNLLPTLKILQYLADRRILLDYEVTSVYRDPELNSCAGGAPGSKHVRNAAIDFRLGPASNPTAHDLLLIEYSKRKLCDFWLQYGRDLNMGLGVYASGQIHIDTLGYRTWGPDLTWRTSICNVEDPNVQQPVTIIQEDHEH